MSSKVKYHRLSQSDEEGDDGADEEEDEDEDEGFEENILFDSRLVNTPVMERGEVFELERLGQPRVIGGSRARIIVSLTVVEIHRKFDCIKQCVLYGLICC